MSVIYEIEFTGIPYIFNGDKDAFFVHMQIEGREYLCDIFNDFYKYCAENGRIEKAVTFSPEDFIIVNIPLNEGKEMMYVQLPKPAKEDMPRIFCEAYCIPFIPDKQKIKIMDLYAVEYDTMFGTRSLCKTENKEHYNYGATDGSIKDITQKLLKIAFK